MLSKIDIPNLEVLRAEHEAALASMEQQSQAERKREEWLRSRIGVFTSSELIRLMGYEDKINTLPSGAITYIEEKVIEIKTDGLSMKDFTSKSMERGSEMEIVAIAHFEEKYDVTCYATGEDQELIKFNECFGGTPDGLIDINDLIEVKCPDSKTHYNRLRTIHDQQSLKEKERKIYLQIQGNLLATGRQRGFFIDFDDRFSRKEEQMLVVEVLRNEIDIEKIKIRLELANELKKHLLKFK
jgi:hypothetical protein